MATSGRAATVIALVSVVGAMLTAVASGAFQYLGSRAQIEKDLSVVELQTLDRREMLVRQKYEALQTELSDFMSFLRSSDKLSLSEVQARLAAPRRAAYALSAYAEPPLANAAIVLVETLHSTAVEPSGKAAGQLVEAAKQLTVEFFAEMRRTSERRLILTR
jgi:hypothetical protein